MGFFDDVSRFVGKTTATVGQVTTNAVYTGSGIVVAPFYAAGEGINRLAGGEEGTFNVFEARTPKEIDGSFVSGQTLSTPVRTVHPANLADLALGSGGAPAAPTDAVRSVSLWNGGPQIPLLNPTTGDAVAEQFDRIDWPDLDLPDLSGLKTTGILVLVGLGLVAVIAVAA